jgi:hypothetical protein
MLTQAKRSRPEFEPSTMKKKENESNCIIRVT